jgi:CheY-like chemotaxis protein
MALVAGIAVAFTALGADDEDQPAPKPKAKAAKKAAPRAKPAAKPSEGPVEWTPPNDPAVEAVLETKPNTPADWARAAQMMAALRRPDLAREFLGKVLAAKLKDDQLTALADQFGVEMFADMAARPELLPEAEQLAEGVLGAVNRRTQDPKRIAEAIQQLQDPSEDVRVKALANLKNARGAAVGALIDVLADPARTAAHRAARAALVQMRQLAEGPLVGILEHCDLELMIQAISALAEMNARDTAIYMVGPASAEKADPKVRAVARAALVKLTGQVPDQRAAVEMLCRQAKVLYRQRQPLKTNAEGRIEQWSWDGVARRCVARSRSMDDAARVLAARLARDAFALAPEDANVRLLYLATMLEEASYEHGLDKPLDLDKDPAARVAAGFGAKLVEAVLDFAVANGRPAAATVAAQILGRIGKAQAVLRQGTDPAPLVRVLRHPDRRLRMAAAQAIVQLQPDDAFPGSSYVPEVLGFFAATTGQRRVLVAGPNVEVSREQVGMLSMMRYHVDTATTGREALRLATASPDYELVLIDPGIADPLVGPLVEQLRRDYRTASQRIGLLARAGYFDAADRLAQNDPMMLSFPRPHNQDAFQWQLNHFLGLGSREFVGFEERQQQAAAALGCLAVLAQSSKKIYDIRRTQDEVFAAMYAPGLTSRVVAVLANLGTPESQQALVDLACRMTQPIEVRKAAAKAFRLSTKKYGILLTTDSLRQQYDRYEASRQQDLDTQQLLSTILDSIEEPTEATRPVKAIGKPAEKKEPMEKSAEKEAETKE